MSVTVNVQYHHTQEPSYYQLLHPSPQRNQQLGPFRTDASQAAGRQTSTDPYTGQILPSRDDTNRSDRREPKPASSRIISLDDFHEVRSDPPTPSPSAHLHEATPTRSCYTPRLHQEQKNTADDVPLPLKPTGRCALDIEEHLRASATYSFNHRRPTD